MDNHKIVLNIADDVNCLKTCNEIGKYYVKKSVEFSENKYNFIILLLGMCVNKELTIVMLESQNAMVEDFPEKLKQIYSVMLNKYRRYNYNIVEKMENIDENQFFLGYLNDMTERILVGIKYIEKKSDEAWRVNDEVNEWNTQYHREERIRDYMKQMITDNGEFTKFTKRHRIQLPYMYVLAWDLPNLLKKYEDRNKKVDKQTTSYLELLPANVRICLSFLDDRILDILLYGVQDTDDFEDGDTNSPFIFVKSINFVDLLPTLVEVEKKSFLPIDDLVDGSVCAKVRAKRMHIRPYIKKEILSKKPLVPMEIDKTRCNLQLLRMMVDVLKEENKTQNLNKQLKDKNAELEVLNSEKVDMMDYYAHSWKHISYPKIVKDVAEALLSRNDDDSVTMANKLLRAYNSEQTLKHGIQLLQYSIAENKEKVKNEFKNGFFVISLPKEDGIVGIDKILSESLDMVILKLMMDDVDTSRRMKKCRSKIENISKLREEYTELFLKNIGQKEMLLEWVNTNFFNLSFAISEEWKAVRLSEESFAAAQMTEIFVELLTNIFQHGDKSAKLVLSSDINSMDIFEFNDCVSSKMRKDGKGIRTLGNVIDKINFESNIENGVVYSKTDKEYSIHIKFNKKLIYKE